MNVVSTRNKVPVKKPEEPKVETIPTLGAFALDYLDEIFAQ
jgi:hypothetical protein